MCLDGLSFQLQRFGIRLKWINNFPLISLVIRSRNYLIGIFVMYVNLTFFVREYLLNVINTVRPGQIEKAVMEEREKRTKKAKCTEPIKVIPEIAFLL